jgi:hypothetical protein
MALIFLLSQNSLEVYDELCSFDCLIDSINTDGRVLQLHDKFDQLWSRLYSQHIAKCTEINIVLMPKASFTDTRIISIWCRSHCFFNPKVDLKIQTQVEFESQLSRFETDIIYSQAPKIGSKN